MRAPFQSLLPLNLLQTGVNLKQLHSYRLLKNGQAHGPSSPRFSLPLVLTFLLTILVVVSGIWFKTHPTFFYDLRVASRISIDAEITLYATVKAFDGSISTPDSPLPVPQLETSLLADAKIGSTVAATASLEVYPRVIEPGDLAPKANEILFAVATTADRAIERMSRGLWPAFMMNPQSPCFVVLAPEEAHRVKSVRQVSDSLGLHCVVKASRLKRYPWRVLNLPREAEQPFQDASPSVKWIVIGDDDTLWMDKNGLLRTLGRHDHREMKFIACTTEQVRATNWYGKMSYGGGGLILSSGLMTKFNEILPECFRRWPDIFGGDEMISNCAALAQGVEDRSKAYINEPAMHQFDTNGLVTGLLEMGTPMMSIHHFFSWAKLMPDWMHGGDTHRIIHTLLKASHFLGQDNMFQRFSLDGGRVILVNGYSITTYQEALTADDLSKIEYTWSRNPDDTLIYENVRPPIRVVGHRKTKWDLEGNQRKSPYYLDEVRDVDMVNGRATFVYRNDRSSRITIHWEEWKQRQS